MSALLSLPLWQYLLPTSVGSYTTSLNLLLFSLTWSTVVLAHSPVKIEVGGTLVILLLTYLIPLFLALGFEYLFPEAAANIRLNVQRNRAANTANRGKGKGRSKAQVSPHNPAVVRSNINTPPARVLVNALLNIALTCALVALSSAIAAAAYPGSRTKSAGTALNISSTPPLPWTFIQQLLYAFLFREGIKYLAPMLAQQRTGRGGNKRQDETKYDLDFVARVWLPAFSWAVVSRAHVLGYFLMLAIRSLEAVRVQRGFGDGDRFGGVAVSVVRRVIGL